MAFFPPLTILINYLLTLITTIFITIASWGAKETCSALFIQHRLPSFPIFYPEITSSSFPLNLIPHVSTIEWDITQKIVKSSVPKIFGLSRYVKFDKTKGCQFMKIKNPEVKNFKSSTIQQTENYFKLNPIKNLNDTESFLKFGFKIETNTNISEKIDNSFKYFFDNSEESKKMKVRTVLVYQKGTLIYEKYNKEWGFQFTKNTPQAGWSMNKSILNLLIGIRQKQGFININQTLNLWPGYPSKSSDPRNSVKIDSAMAMDTGLKCENSKGIPSDVTNLLYYSDDVVKFSLNQGLYETNQLTKFCYSSATANLVGKALRNTFNSDQELLDFIKNKFYIPLGFHENSYIEPDAVGNLVFSSFAYFTARDWLKFGILFLQNGTFNGNQLVYSDWVNSYSKTLSPNSDGKFYRFFWNLKNIGLENVFTENTYAALGHDRQKVIIIPELESVIVVLGKTEKSTISIEKEKECYVNLSNILKQNY